MNRGRPVMDTRNNENNVLREDELEQISGGKVTNNVPNKVRTATPAEKTLLSKGICPRCKKKISPYNNSKNKFTCAQCKVFYVQTGGFWSIV